MQYYGCTLHKLYFIKLPVQYSRHAPSKNYFKVVLKIRFNYGSCVLSGKLRCEFKILFFNLERYWSMFNR